MPLVAAALAAYAAGLLAGFGGVAVPAAVVAGLAGAVAALARRRVVAALAALVLAGLAVARMSQREDRSCLARLAALPVWSATLDDALSPGAAGLALVKGPGCEMRARVAVTMGAAPAGARVLLRGVVVPSRRGLGMEGAALTLPGEPRAPFPALRAALGRRIDVVFGPDAPLARALLIADERELDPGVRRRFAAAGIVHLLSISGLHVGLIALALGLLLGALHLPRPVAAGATVLLTALYIAAIGAPAPAVRAGVMLGVELWCRTRQRPIVRWAGLALGAAVAMRDPRTVTQVGFQLSVAGMAGLVASEALARRWVAPRLDGWRAAAARTLLAAVVAGAVTAPIIAWRFGSVSLISPLANVVATPLMALIQPALFLALLAAPVPALASVLGAAVHPMLAALDAVATAAASVPGATLALAPTLSGALLAGAACVALIAACTSPFPARAGAVALGALAVALWAPCLPRRAAEMELHVLDAGQGDALALRTPRGRWVLLDAGRAWPTGDAGRRLVVPYVRRRGGEVAAFILSHPDADHSGGAASVLSALRPAAYWDAGFVGQSAPYDSTLETAARARVAWRRARAGDTLRVDGVTIAILAPDSAWVARATNPNAASVVALAQYGAVRFLLMGDAGRGEEALLLARSSGALRADVLKVGHHGSRGSTGDQFLAAVRPRLALLSVGAGNSYGLPARATLDALRRVGAAVRRTDLEGSIVVRTDGRRVRVATEERTWTDIPLAASAPP